jgi:hypothetical protein
MQVTHFSVKFIDYFLHEYSSTWPKYWEWYRRPEATFDNRKNDVSQLGRLTILRLPRVKWH